eukprot:910529-Alexandrium_andersonii.AAC.1
MGTPTPPEGAAWPDGQFPSWRARARGTGSRRRAARPRSARDDGQRREPRREESPGDTNSRH